MQKNETGPLTYIMHTKKSFQNELKMNVRPETDKFLEENIGGQPLNVGLVNYFFGFDTKSEGNKSNNK